MLGYIELLNSIFTSDAGHTRVNELDDLLHSGSHVVVSLSLLRQLRLLYEFTAVRHVSGIESERRLSTD